MAEQKNLLQDSVLPGKRRFFQRFLFALWCALFCTGLIATALFLHRHGLEHSVQLIKHFAGEDLGAIILALIGLYILRTVIFIPSSFLGALTGLLLSQNPWLALIFALTAASASSFLSFGIARTLGRSWVAEHETERLKHFDDKVRARGFFTIFILRLLIFVPFDLINMASGFSSIRFRDYAWGTILGLIPEVALQVLVGNSIPRFFGHTIWQAKFLFLALALGIGLYAVGRFLKNHHHFQGLISHPKESKAKQKRSDQ